MTIDLLDAPLRMSWDLHGESGPMRLADALTVAAALGEASIFFVTLDRRPLAHPGIKDLLSILSVRGCRVLLVCQGSEAELGALDAGLDLHTLFLDADPFIVEGRADIDTLSAVLETLNKRHRDPCLLLTPRRDNVAAIPALLDFCRAEGVGKFKLPNTRYDDSVRHNRGEQLLRPADLRALERLLEGSEALGSSEVSLEIHDLFLWELFHPAAEGGRSGYGGCQAGNSLGHVDAAGRLFPCSSWPEPIGSLLEAPLSELWDSRLRRRVRQVVAREPDGCAGCRDFALCLGGCRGLAEGLAGRFGGRDPLCGGPR